MRAHHAVLVVSVLSACRSFDPPGGAAPAGECCEGAGSCVPAALAPPGLSERLDQDTCGESLLCAPSAWVRDPEALPTRCEIDGEREGRCMPSCLPEVAEQSERLSRENCERNQLCVPCFDPVSGEDTQACRIGRDAPREKPALFERCCEDHGTCIPEQALLSSLDLDQRARLGAGECSEDSQALCVPDAFLDEDARRATCHAAGELEGRCLPSCLPEVERQAERLQQRDCDRDQRCVPCFDPITGEDTQACRNGKDKPRETARGYERCCGAPGAQLGTCLPVELLSAAQLDALPIDSCRRAGTRCAPSEVLTPAQKMPTCSAQGFAIPTSPGLCLAECFMPTALRFFTPRASCAAPRRCVPCSSLDVDQPGCE